MRPPRSPPFVAFGAAMRAWLLRANRSQKELAHALRVDPSTVTTWVRGLKRPDSRSLIKLLATFRGWFHNIRDPPEALDAVACHGYDWARVLEASARYFQEGADTEHIQAWWEAARPAQCRLFLPPRPVIHVTRDVERDLVANLTALSGYRRARWRAVILHGMAGIAKTAIARALADDERVTRAFRDGIAWVDGSRDPKEEVTRLCLTLNLERAPGERWVECWRRWVGTDQRRLLLIVDDAISAEGLPLLIAGLGPQVVALITTQQGAETKAEVERWLPDDAVMEMAVRGLASTEGRQLVEAVVGRSLNDPEWELIQEVGERAGWHPEALRLAAIEGRDSGWQGMLDDLQANRLPWSEVSRMLMKQWVRLHVDQQAWSTAMIERKEPGAGFAADEAASCCEVKTATAGRWLWILERCGLEVKWGHAEMAFSQWHVEPVARLALTEIVQRYENIGIERQ
jgi:transcriptional regulator with XRE-family HTH domain